MRLLRRGLITRSANERRRFLRAEDRDALPAWPRKESYPCCVSRRDDLGRMPIGDCSPTCERRAARRSA